MVGLHGAERPPRAKLAKRWPRTDAHPCSLPAASIVRPRSINLSFSRSKNNSLAILTGRTKRSGHCAPAWEESKRMAASLIFDTAGRLQIDDDLVRELELLKKEVNPHEILLVADAALGQEAVNVAKTFHERLSLTGIVLTKIDGDARGGAALSMKKVTGAPIKFLGVGEKIDEFEVFHPDRLASRILGMGDVVSLVEKAQENLDQEESMRMAEKMLKAEFDFEDFLTQMKQMKKMGSMGSVAKMLPGMNNVEIGDKEEALWGVMRRSSFR